MKDSNIVVALNRTLTEYFGTPCLFHSFTAEVATEISYYTGALQGQYGATLEFYANKPLPTKMLDSDSTYVADSECIATETCSFYKHTCYVLLGSRLRKKLLKVMLKYNAG